MSNTNSASGGIYIEVNSKDLMANKIKNDRKFYIREDLSTQQLQEFINGATLKSDLASQANKKVSSIADEELGLVDKDGNPCTLAQKKAEINKQKGFPYNIPIIGWLIKKIEIAMLESDHAEKRAEIKGRDPWNKIFTSQDIEKEKEVAKANKKKVEELGKFVGGVYKIMKEKKLLNEEVIKKFDKLFQENGIEENNSVNKETLIKIAEAEKKDLQQNQTQTAAPGPRTTISEQLGESNGSRKPEEQKSSTNTNERPPTDSEVSFMVGMPIHTSYSQMNKALKELRAQEQQSRQQSQPKSQQQPQRQSVSTGKNNTVSVTIGSMGGSGIDIQSNINANGVVARQNTNIRGEKIIQQQGVQNGQQFSGQQQVLNGQNIMQGQFAQNGERNAIQMQGMNDGRVLQISNPSQVQANSIINSGATGVGTGQSRSKGNGIGQ